MAAALDRMRGTLRDAMAEGAFGVSSGLDYPPGSFAPTEELAALTAEAGRHGGFYHTHVRYPLGDRYLDPFREAIEIGRRAGAPAHITHFYHRDTHPGGPEPMLALVDDARSDGLDVTFDTYPSEWASTRLLIQLPQWIQAGGPGPLKARLADRAARDRVRAEFTARGASYASAAGWADVRLGAFRRPENLRWESRSVADVMTETGHDALDVICDLLLAEDLGLSQVTSGPSAATLPLFVAHPVGMVGTDSTFFGDKPGPRTYGSFPRILGQFVRDEALLSLEEAVRKMTSAAAARLGLRDRGVIRDGAVADLVVFDPATVRSTATYDAPRSFPIGIEHVIVAGTPVVTDGVHTGALPGRGLRHGTRLTGIRPGRASPRSRGPTSVRCSARSAARRSPRRSSANIRSWASANASARLPSRRGRRPAHGQAHRDRARFEPQLTGGADPFDVVHGLDLAGLGQQHAETTGPEPRDMVGAAGLARRGRRPARAGSGRRRPARGRS